MEAKSFFSKSSTIFSVAILVAGLSTFGAGVYISETNAKDMQKEEVKIHKQQLKEELKVKNLEKLLEQAKNNNGVINNQLQNEINQVNALTQQNDDLKKQITTYQDKSESPSSSPNVSPVESSQKKVNVVATAYVSNCQGCGGVTATGINVRNNTTYNGKVIIATDPNVIPLHSNVEVTTEDGKSFMAVVEDKGGAITGNKIDVLVPSYSQAISFGRKKATLTILS